MNEELKERVKLLENRLNLQNIIFCNTLRGFLQGGYFDTSKFNENDINEIETTLKTGEFK